MFKKLSVFVSAFLLLFLAASCSDDSTGKTEEDVANDVPGDVVQDVEAEPDAVVDMETEPDAVADVETEPDAVADVETEPDAVADVETEPDAIADVETEPDAIADMPDETFVDSIYSVQPEIMTYSEYLAANPTLPSGGYENILLWGDEKDEITVDGYVFKDSNGDGELQPYEDWRLSPQDRVADLVSRLTYDQKLGLLSWGSQRQLGSVGEAQLCDGGDNDGDACAPDSSECRNSFGGGDPAYCDTETSLCVGGRDDGDACTPDSVECAGGGSCEPVLTYGVDGLEIAGSVSGVADNIMNLFQRHSNLSWSLDPMVEATWLNNVQGLCERAPLGVPWFVTSEPDSDSNTYATNYDLSDPPTNELSPWPYYIGFAAADDLAISQSFGNVLRQELRMRGRHAIFGPMADLATEPRWARMQHSFGAYGDVAASHLEVIVHAIQGGDLDENVIGVDGAIAIVKHFPGMGPDEQGMDSHSFAGRYNAYPGNNFAEHLLPWEAVLPEAGGVMLGYSIVDTRNYVRYAVAYVPALSTDLLRGLGFTGSTVTDNNPGPWGIEDGDSLSRGQKAARALAAGANQWLGGQYLNDWREADDAGLLDIDDVNRSVTQSLQLQFELGLFENPYVDLDAAAAFWDPNGAALRARVAAGQHAQQAAMVLVKNTTLDEDGNDLLPVIQANTDLLDFNDNGSIDVYFDSMFDGYDSGEENTYATSDRYEERNFVADIADADVAIIRIFARGGQYFGAEGGVPLSFDGQTYFWDREAQAYCREDTGNEDDPCGGVMVEVNENSRTRAGYRVVGGSLDNLARVQAAIDARDTNPDLMIIVGMTSPRPGIVAPFLDDIDGLFIDYGANDDAFLDMIFYHDGVHPTGRLPVEIPADDASVEEQFEDVPCDTPNPTFACGFGLDYDEIGGY